MCPGGAWEEMGQNLQSMMGQGSDLGLPGDNGCAGAECRGIGSVGG